VRIDFNTYNSNFVGNVYGQAGDVTTRGAGIHNRGVSSDYLYNDTNNQSNPTTGQNLASYYVQGNYSYLLNTTDWIGGTVVTLPASLYYSSKPSWWGTLPFPAIGPDCSPVNGSIPAEMRYRAHTAQR
jgi:hypothetical protein